MKSPSNFAQRSADETPLEAMSTLLAQASLSPVSLVIPGAGMKASFQTGCIIQTCKEMKQLGWEYPYRLAAGSSSGSPLAVIAAAASPLDHNAALDNWQEFRRLLTRSEFVAKSSPRNIWLPVQDAVDMLLEEGGLLDIWHPVQDAVDMLLEESGLLDWERAYESPTNLVIVVPNFDVEHALNIWARRGAKAWDRLTSSTEDPSDELIAGGLSSFGAESTTALLKPLYYATNPWPDDSREDPPENYKLLKNVDHLKKVVRDSILPPRVSGGLTEMFERYNLIDGAWGNKLSIQLAAAHGGDRLHLVDSSRSGKALPLDLNAFARAQKLVAWHDHPPERYARTSRFFSVPDAATIELLYRKGIELGKWRAEDLPSAT